MTDDSDSALWMIIGITVIVAVVIGAAVLATYLNGNQERDMRFEGACTALHGTIHDDVCIDSEGSVVLTIDDYKKLEETQ